MVQSLSLPLLWPHRSETPLTSSSCPQLWVSEGTQEVLRVPEMEPDILTTLWEKDNYSKTLLKPLHQLGSLLLLLPEALQARPAPGSHV